MPHGLKKKKKKVLTLESMVPNIAEYGMNLAAKQQKLTLLTWAEKEFGGGTVHRVSTETSSCSIAK